MCIGVYMMACEKGRAKVNFVMISRYLLKVDFTNTSSRKTELMPPKSELIRTTEQIITHISDYDKNLDLIGQMVLLNVILSRRPFFSWLLCKIILVKATFPDNTGILLKYLG